MKKKAQSYGKAVFKHLDAVKKRLLSSQDNKRQSWLRLLKELCDFVAATQKLVAVDKKSG